MLGPGDRALSTSNAEAAGPQSQLARARRAGEGDRGRKGRNASHGCTWGLTTANHYVTRALPQNTVPLITQPPLTARCCYPQPPLLPMSHHPARLDFRLLGAAYAYLADEVGWGQKGWALGHSRQYHSCR